MLIPAASQDIIYLSKWKSDSSRDVVFVNDPSNADVCINVVRSKSDIKRYPNAWYFTNQKSEAKYTFRMLCDGDSRALKIYLYDPPVDYLSWKWKDAYKKYFTGSLR